MSPARLRDLLLGVLALALVAGGLGLAYLSYSRVLTPHEDITLRTDVVGNALRVGSDVKYHGVPIGRVSSIDATDQGAELTLALDPDSIGKVPANAVARLLPSTLFGERYVMLVAPEATGPSDSPMQAGAVITQDDSAEAAELQQVFDEMLPMLRAIQPDKLSAMLAEFATMLEGNGENLGDSLVDWSRYVKKMNPKVPQMAEDFERLASVADSWTIAAPDLLDALSTMTSSTQLIVEQRTNLADLYAGVIGSADTAKGWVGANHDTIVVLAEESKDALRASAPYASQFPCLFRAVAGMKGRMDTVLGQGTDEPGLHAVVQVVPAREKYLVGKDELSYTTKDPGPRCPYVTGQVGTSKARSASPSVRRESETSWPAVPADQPGSGSAQTPGAGATEPPSIPPPPASPGSAYLSALTGLGPANSPDENQMIAEIMAPSQGLAPTEFPEWNSLLLGPTLRNTKVVLK